jgi:D-sedoheptulose 7-phosphate isomerase
MTTENLPLLQKRMQESIDLRQKILDGDLLEAAARVADVLVEASRNRRCVFFFGNGGSSTDASHLATELLGRFYYDRPSLPSIALADSTAALTAIGNDYSYEEVFSRPLSGLGKAGDVAVGLTTSGNSKNVVRALQVAREMGLVTVAFTGGKGGAVVEQADHVLAIPSTDTPRIQECHMLIGHTICEIVEARLYPNE